MDFFLVFYKKENAHWQSSALDWMLIVQDAAIISKVNRKHYMPNFSSGLSFTNMLC